MAWFEKNLGTDEELKEAEESKICFDCFSKIDKDLSIPYFYKPQQKTIFLCMECIDKNGEVI